MENGEVKKNKDTKKIIALVVFLLLTIGLIILLVNLFKEKVTYTSTDNKTIGSTSLICKTSSTDITGAFFDIRDAKNADQQIKTIFSDNKIDSITYSSTIRYEDDATAKKREAELHFKYGSYMQDDGKEMTDFSPNFSISGQELKISLYATLSHLSSATAKIFLINATEDSLNSYTPNSLKALYEAEGFACEIK